MEIGARENARADLDGEPGEDLHSGQARDEMLGARLVQDRADPRSAKLSMVVLDQGAGVQEIARHQKRSARSSSMMTRAMESLILEVASRTSSKVTSSS